LQRPRNQKIVLLSLKYPICHQMVEGELIMVPENLSVKSALLGCENKV
jgi:hypothetical protein